MTDTLHEFHTFRQRLHRGGTWSYFWRGDTKKSLWFPTHETPEIPASWAGVNTFFGIHPTVAARGDYLRSRIADISAINCLFAEIDGKDLVHPTQDQISAEFERITSEARARVEAGQLTRMTPEKTRWTMAAAAARATIFATDVDHYNQLAREHVERFPVRPSAIIFSGGGWHLYWLLSETFQISNKTDRQRARDLQRSWVRFVGGDIAAADLTRVLRPVGTKNFKDRYAPNYPTVAFEHLDYATEYDLDYLESLLPVEPTVTKTALPEHTEPQELTTGSHPSPSPVVTLSAHLEPLEPPTEPVTAPSPWAAFNQAYTVEQMLERYGYVRHGERYALDADEDRPGILINADNTCCAFATSDPLYRDQKPVRPFEIFRTFEHDGDFTSARIAAAFLFGMEYSIGPIAVQAIAQVSEWLLSADLSQHVPTEHHAQRRLQDGTVRHEYRTGHSDKLVAARVLDVMRTAGYAYRTGMSLRQIATTENSDGVPVMVCSPETVRTALVRLAWLFDVEQTERGLLVTLRSDTVVLIRLDTPIDTRLLEVSNLTQTTATPENVQQYRHLYADDAYLVGTSLPVRRRVRKKFQELRDIEGVDMPGLLKLIPSGLSTYAIPIIAAMIDAGGAGITTPELQEASGASRSRVYSVLKTLRQFNLVESQRQYKAPSVHWIEPQVFERIKNEVTPELKTSGIGVHRLDRDLESQVRHNEITALVERDPERKNEAEKRVKRARQRRMVTVAATRPHWTPEQVRQFVYHTETEYRNILPSPEAMQRAAAMFTQERHQERQETAEAIQETVEQFREYGYTRQQAHTNALYAGFSEDEAGQIARAMGVQYA